MKFPGGSASLKRIVIVVLMTRHSQDSSVESIGLIPCSRHALIPFAAAATLPRFFIRINKYKKNRRRRGSCRHCGNYVLKLVTGSRDRNRGHRCKRDAGGHG